jgi:lysophospholipase L1-like esterase
MKDARVSPGTKTSKLLLAIFSTLAALVAAELGFRWTQLCEFRRSLPKRTGNLLLLPDSPQAYSLRPDSRGSYRFQEARRKKFHYSTNHLGLRDRDRAEKAASEHWTLVLGDSYVFGYAVETAEAFPEVTETLLHERGYSTFEVINAGIPGYNTVQERTFLESLLPPLEPDLVVLAYVMNDAEPQGATTPSPRQIFRYSWSWLWEELKDRANVTFCAEHPCFRSRKNLTSRSYLEGFSGDSPKWRDSRNALREMLTICAARGVAFLVLIVPDFTQPFDSRYPFGEIHQAVSAWGRELGVPTFDLMTIFRDRDHVELQVQGDGHPNPEAHREIARFLADRILERQLDGSAGSGERHG